MIHSYIQWLTGSDFQVYAYYMQSTIPMVGGFPSYLNQQKSIGKIADWTAITFPLSWIGDNSNNDGSEANAKHMKILDMYISNLAGSPSLSQWVVGCQENYLNVMWTEFLDIESSTSAHGSTTTPHLSNGDIDVVKLLYVDAGKATLDWEENGIEVPPPISNNYYFGSSEHSFYYAKKANKVIHDQILKINESYHDYMFSMKYIHLYNTYVCVFVC